MKTVTKQKTPGTVNSESKSHKGYIVAAALALFLIVLTVRAFRSNPVDQARQLRAQLFSQDEDLSSEERQELGKKLRDQVKELTPEQRRELMNDRQKEMAKEMERFFQLPAAEQQQELDKKNRSNDRENGKGRARWARRRSGRQTWRGWTRRIRRRTWNCRRKLGSGR
jgi:hypothetical protein